MDWKDIGSKIAQYAPEAGATLGTIVGGPIGTAIGGIGGKVVQMIASVLGCEATPDAVDAVLEKDPQAYIKLKEMENALIIKLKEFDLEIIKGEYADKASARDRQVQHEKAVGKSDVNLYAFAWLNTFGFYGILGGFLYIAYNKQEFTITEAVGAILYMLIGALVTNYTSINAYFFGSSRGSDMKTGLMNIFKK